jgi:DNA repair exonuclease SbcCD ATPase subunit
VPKYNIEVADFEKQKAELKRFAEQPATSTQLDKFNTSGEWSDFWSGGIPGLLSGHKVTGEELNGLVTKLQNCFVEINERDRKVIKEFGQVYETFEALDKGYIQGILISVKSAEKASQEAKAAQKDVDDTIKALQITINKLKEFKDSVTKNKHLKDIDRVWSDVQKINQELNGISKRLNEQQEKNAKRLSELEKFQGSLSKLEHLSDVDTMWGDIQSTSQSLTDLSSQLSDNLKGVNERIDALIRFEHSITQHKHLHDIDTMWESVKFLSERANTVEKSVNTRFESIENSIKAHSEIVDCQTHIKDVDALWDKQAEQEEKIARCIESVEQYTEIFAQYENRISGLEEELRTGTGKLEKEISGCTEQIEDLMRDNASLSERIKVSTIIAGGAITISIIQLLLVLAGVL